VGRVTRTKSADDDLDEIWLRVAIDNTAAADRLIDRIVARCRDLAEYPRLGPARPEIAPDARMLAVSDHLVIHRVDGENVQIVRVVHGARRLHSLLPPT
jgi:toxin ParE1/3/4